MKKAYENTLQEAVGVIKHGILTDKIVMEIKMTASLYEYIEVIVNYYDDEDNPGFNNWTDVEGFGYGWAWCRWDESRWHEMMTKEVKREADRLWRDTERGYYVVSENNEIKTFQLIGERGERRKDVIVSFSNNELDY